MAPNTPDLAPAASSAVCPLAGSRGPATPGSSCVSVLPVRASTLAQALLTSLNIPRSLLTFPHPSLSWLIGPVILS